ncbi:hypothetical protein [Labrys neptuniae]
MTDRGVWGHFVIVRGGAVQIRARIEFEIFQSQIVRPKRGRA